MSRREISKLNDDALLAAYRAAACADADAHFDERALETQRHKILARLEHLGQPAKVIRFPKAPAGEAAVTPVNRRWISVAAAAGLLLGLVGGELAHLVAPQSRPQPVAASLAPSAASRPGIIPASTTVDDDGLLGEIDMAVQMRSAAELRVLDELTPFHEPR
jgi:hypothetical protein